MPVGDWKQWIRKGRPVLVELVELVADDVGVVVKSST